MTNDSFPSRARVLHSWKEIAAYSGRGVRTIQRYEAQYGFPVRRPAGRPRSAVLALSTDVDRWLEKTPMRRVDRPDGLNGRSQAANGFGVRSSMGVDLLRQKIQIGISRSAALRSNANRSYENAENAKLLCDKLRATWERSLAIRTRIGAPVSRRSAAA